MLTIVTGLPGACKTLYTLSKLFPLFADRQIYVYDINEIDHAFFGTLPLEDPEAWYELPEGAVIVMDEAQKVFPVRRAGSLVPQKCSEFETHRHKGFDIILLTQDATLLDVHIRKLAGKHIHCQRLFNTQSSTIFEYNKFQPKPEDRNTIKKAVASPTWMFDKKMYGHYKSSDLHTHKAKIPKRLLIVPVVLLVGVVVVWFAAQKLIHLFGKDPAAAFETGKVAQVDGEGRALPVLSGVDKWVAARTPVVEGLPWTAPLYAEVQDVKTFPKPHCIIFGIDPGKSIGKCACYSQQLTRMPSVNNAVCRQLAEQGWFDASIDPEAHGQNRAERGQAVAVGEAERKPTLVRDRDSLRAYVPRAPVNVEN